MSSHELAGGGAPYLDLEANVFGGAEDVPLVDLDGPDPAFITGACGSVSARGECPDDHEYRKLLMCNRDWCGTCGAHWSYAHRRRFAGWLSRLLSFGRLGYLVVTIPTEHRPRTKGQLSQVGSSIVEVLKERGLRRGLRRWHYFGDLWTAYWQQKAPQLSRKAAQRMFGEKTAEDARRDGVVPKWHPHLNLLVDGELVPARRDKFLEWREQLLDALELELGYRPVIHYQWTDAPGKKIHIAKYVLRSTFLDCEWDGQMAREIRGFRNSLEWGSRASWAVPPVWELRPDVQDAGELDEPIRPEVVQIQNGECPCCGGKITWSGVEKTSEWRDRVAEDYGAGYVRLRPRERRKKGAT